MIEVGRERVRWFRQRATHLHARLAPESFATAARCGIQDSAPRAGVIALHARVHDVAPEAWQDRALVQVWGPRAAVYLVSSADRGVFTLGLSPRSDRARAELRAHAAPLLEALHARGEVPGALVSGTREGRVAASTTGCVAIRWDARDTTVRLVDTAACDAEDARLELARRFLEALGPSDASGFARWAGVSLADARGTFAKLEPELVPVDVHGTRCLLLACAEEALRSGERPESVRLLPPGDPYLTAPDRSVLVEEDEHRARLWPRSVPPGAVLVRGEIVGTWRRRGGDVSVSTWGALDRAGRDALEDEATRLPVRPSVTNVHWQQ